MLGRVEEEGVRLGYITLYFWLLSINKNEK